MITPIITQEMIPQILKNMATNEVVVSHKIAEDIDAIGMIEKIMEDLPNTLMEKWRNGQIAFVYPAIPTGHIEIMNIQ